MMTKLLALTIVCTLLTSCQECEHVTDRKKKKSCMLSALNWLVKHVRVLTILLTMMKIMMNWLVSVNHQLGELQLSLFVRMKRLVNTGLVRNINLLTFI